MANRQIEVNLLFKAQTEQAKANIQQIGQLLNTIATTTTIGVNSGQLQQAVSSAQQLQIHLQNATNVNTGKINLDSLNASLKASGASLSTLMTNLTAAGPTGQQAFIKIANAISAAEGPALRLGGHMKAMMVTFVNTAKWQVASMAINGIMNSIRGAISYAEDLNTALNEIRIVSSQSAVDMAHFAEKANEAARALNTTTTEYAKAALIFYQQGLEGSDVTDRADAVIKLANVTKQSAQVVSDQMTAIWNNFDDGTKSLEYYGDVITKLGATTAASTSEISDGLEKFAAIGKTVGLSYEYATAAVATVVDKTRQSAEVVGTAFKTIFARMEGLSLGETLEDGTDLNKYSEALLKIGVDIKDGNGQLKDMDTILDEVGSKWKLLGKDAQVALAQSVGGLRQYNQFIAMMDNWDEVKINVDVAMNAEGSLEEQQKIWSESWEAAAKRVEQAKNELYSKFLNDEAITKITDVFAGLIDGIGRVIDAMGGVGPMLLMIIGVFSKSLVPMMVNGFQRITNAASVLTGSAARNVAAMKSQMSAQMMEMMNDSTMSAAIKEQMRISLELSQTKDMVAKASKNLSQAEQMELKMKMQIYEATALSAQAALEEKAALEEEIKVLKEKVAISNPDVIKNAAKNTMRSKHPRSFDETTETLVDNNKKSLQGNENRLRQLNSMSEDDYRSELIMRKDNLTKSLKGMDINSESYKQVTVEIDKIENGLQDVEKLRKQEQKDLKLIIEYQKEVKALEVNPSKATVGKVNTVSSTKRTDQTGSYKTAQENIKNTLGATPSSDFASPGEMEIGVSVEQLEKTYALMSDYATKGQEVKAMLTDLKAVSSEYTTTIQAQQTAEQELDSANSRVEETTQALDTARKNLEKSSNPKTQKAYENALKAQEKAVNQQATARKNLEKATKSLEKEQQKFLKSLNSKELDKMEKDIVELAKSMGSSKKEIKQLEQAFSELKSGTNISSNLSIIEKSLGKLSNTADLTEQQLVELANNMVTKLKEAGMSDKEIDELVVKLEKMGMVSTDAANKIRQLNTTEIVPPTKNLQNAITGLASFAGKASMAISSIQMVTSAFEDGFGGMQDWMSLLMAASMLLPVVGSAITFVVGAIKAKAAAEAMESGATLANIASQLVKLGVIKKETAAVWGNVAAWIAKHMAQLGIAGLIVGPILVAGIMAVTKAINADSEAVKANAQANEEAAKTGKEAAEKRQEIVNKCKEEEKVLANLVGTYNSLNEAEEEATKTQEKIKESAQSLIDHYTDLGEALSFTGDQQERYNQALLDLKDAKNLGTANDVNMAAQKLRIVAQEVTAEDARDNAQAQANNAFSKDYDDLDDKITEGSDLQNFRFEDGSYKIDIKASRSDDGDDKKAYKLLADDSVLKYADNVADYGDMTIGFNVNDIDKLNKQWKDLGEWKKAMEDAGLQGTETYSGVAQVYSVLNDRMKEFTEAYSEVEQAEQAKKEGELGDPTQIRNLSDFQKHREKIVESRATQRGITDKNSDDYKKIVDEVTKELEEYEFLSGMANVQGVFDSIERTTGNSTENLTNLFDELTKGDIEKQTIFANIDFNKYQSEKAITAEFERLQGLADAENIQVKIDTYTNALGSLKEDMQISDWENIANGGIDWGGEAIDFSSFMAMSLKEQTSYLNSELSKLTQEKANRISEIQNQLENDTYSGNLSDTERDNLENELHQLETQVAIEQQRNQEQQLKEAMDTGNWAELKQTIEDTGMSTSEAQKAYEDFLEAVSEDMDLDSGEVESLAKQLPYLSQNFKGLSKEIKTDTVLQGQLATRIKQTEKGMKNFAEAQEDIEAGLASDNLIEYSNAMTSLKQSVLDVVGASDEFEDAGITLGANFEAWAQQNYETVILPALNGNKQALSQLSTQIMADAHMQITGATAESTQLVVEALSGFQQGVQNGTILIGQEITDDYKNTIMWMVNTMLIETGKSVEEVNAWLASIGVTAQWAEGKIDSLTYTGINLTGLAGTLDKVIEKTKELDKLQKTDVVDRYKEINDQLEQVSKTSDKVSKITDRLFGKNRISAMQASNKLLEKEMALTKEKRKEAEANLKIDKEALINTGKKANIDFQFDKQGNIINYDESMEALYGYYNDYYEKAKSGGFTEKEEGKLTEIEKIIDNVKTSIDQYEETRDVVDDTTQQLTDSFYEWQDNNAAILSYTLEIKLELNDNELKELEYRLSLLDDDDVFSSSEMAASKMATRDVYVNNIEDLNQAKKDLDEKYNTFDEDGNRAISDAAYKEELEKIRDGLYENAQNLQTLDDEMKHYYSDTLTKANEEMRKQITNLEQGANTLEHYQNALSLIGQDDNYEVQAVVLNGQAKIAENAVKISKANRDLYQKEAEDRKKMYEEAMASGDDAAAAQYKIEYEAALALQQEYQAELEANTEKWLEVEKTKVENQLKAFAKQLEKSLTNGQGFDFIAQQMERSQSLQEEYLTDTNKIYETNKLIAQTQKDIDKTTNTVAKRRLKEFAEETRHLQEKKKLSNFELQQQQAKYNLLLAEIALEEAQNAKSTVRLQRDSEGNFGYVYTADQTAIADAETNYAEKENDLYNLRLDAANNYVSKYQQLMQESAEALNQLEIDRLNGAFASEEEYQRERDALVQYYTQQLESYSELYSLATIDDVRVVRDAWSTAFVGDADSSGNPSLSSSVEQWKNNVAQYSQLAYEAINGWNEQIKTIDTTSSLGLLVSAIKAAEDAADNLELSTSVQDWNTNIANMNTDDSLGALKTKVGEVTSSSETLAQSILNPETGLIKVLGDEIQETKNSTDAWAAYRRTLVGEDGKSGVLGKVGEVTEAINETILTLSGMGDEKNQPDTIKIPYDFDDINEAIDDIQGKLDDIKSPTITITYEYKTIGSLPAEAGNNDLPTTKYTQTYTPAKEHTAVDPATNKERMGNLVTKKGDKSGTVYRVISGNDQQGYIVEDMTWGKQITLKASEMVLATTNNTTSKNNTTPKDTDPPYEVGDVVSINLDGAKDRNARYRTNKGTYEVSDERNAPYQDGIKGTNRAFRETFGFDASKKENGAQKYGWKIREVKDNGWLRLSDINDAWVWQDWVSKYDTGGYTGAWGPEGKLALLHEKELILKPDDTSNFLSALGLLDNILLTLDKYSASAQLGSILSSPAFSMNNQDALEQNVHIEANFPNVQDKNEIEEAFNNLINTASQYANRKY